MSTHIRALGAIELDRAASMRRTFRQALRYEKSLNWPCDRLRWKSAVKDWIYRARLLNAAKQFHCLPL